MAVRTVLATIGAALAVLAVSSLRCGCLPAAVWVAGVGGSPPGRALIERWRYKPLTARPPGPDWQMTDERFVDPETGKLVTVYFHPATGERRYIAA